MLQKVLISISNEDCIEKYRTPTFSWKDKSAYISSFKTTLSAVVATALWVFPVGNVQAIISSIVVANHSHHISKKKLYFRFLGTLLGGLSGLFYVFLFHYVGFVFIGFSSLLLFIFSFIGLSDDEWNYIGLMAGVAFILSVGAINDSSLYYVPAMHRIEGVIMGGICALVIARFIFPKM